MNKKIFENTIKKSGKGIITNIWSIIILILFSAGIASANPGIVVTVIPDSLSSQLGQTITYQVNTQSISDVSEHTVLTIQNPVTGWNYTFDNPGFDIAPGETITTYLHVTPVGSIGTYQSDVLGTAWVPGFEDFTETSFYTFNTIVNKISTNSTITSSNNPSILNQSITLTTTVKAITGSGMPTGDVQFFDGTTLLGTASLNSEVASLSISFKEIGSHTINAYYLGDNNFNPSSGSLIQNVNYNFVGFSQPVDNIPMVNTANAGQAIPLKWRLLDFNNIPVTNLNSVIVTAVSLSCSSGTTTDQIEEYSVGSGLHNLGDGYYQFNWKTPKSYANSCKTLNLDLGENEPRTAIFQFS